MSEKDDTQNGKGNPNQSEAPLPNKPKKFKRIGKNDPSRSKSAPIESFEEEETDNNYIASYNYYVYYNSLKPVDPRLPKPTYTPKPNLEFIKESRKELEEDETPENSNSNLNMNPQIENVTNELDNLNLESNNNMNLGNNSSNNINDSTNIAQNNQEDVNFANFKKNYSQNQTLQNQTVLNKVIKTKEENPNLLNYYQLNQENQRRPGDNINPMPQMYNINANLRNNPNAIYGINPSMNPYSNPYDNMLQMQMPMYNNRNQFNPMNKKGQKKPGLNKPQDNFDYQNQINNIYPNQRIGQIYPQVNPMINYGYGMNYFQNDPNIKYMPHVGGYLNGGIIPNEQSIPLALNVPINIQNPNYNMNMGGIYPNQNLVNNTQNKKKQNKENFMKKEVDNRNIDDIIEKAIQYSKDHSGSRQIQKKYAEGTEEVRNKIFEKLKPEILNLSKDIFGNYVIQKVIDSKDPEKCEIIMETIKGHIAELSLNMYGCRVMQLLISVIDEKYLPQITKELEGKFEKCIEDQNGNHVIQKLIDRLNIGDNSKIFEVVYKKLIQLAKHTYGCRVIQTLLKKCNEQQTNKILQRIYENVVDLSMDQYGNYIIQYILENKIVKDVQPIYEGIKGNIFEFSKHKFASNVVEKTLTLGNKEQRRNIINEILALDNEKKDCIFTLTKDKFGNYVVQKMIEYSDEKTKKDIIERILSNPAMKKKEGFTKHVINFIEKINGPSELHDNNTNFV